MEVVEAGIHRIDDCPVLTRLKAYIVDQGVVCSLKHRFRDRQGNPIDLSQYLPVPASQSDSESEVDPGGSVILRIRDWMGVGINSNSTIYEIVGEAVDPVDGIVKADLEAVCVKEAGIYELTWAVKNADGDFVVANSGIMSVERNLLTRETLRSKNDPGPPTINEIRMWMMDSSGSENTLLDDVEFSDEQICLALTRPIQRWNEAPPPIETYTTRNFPYRGAWASAVLGELFIMMASHYRRNRLGGAAGGLQIDDKNKEREYMAEGQRRLDEYQQWLLNKKVEVNMRKFAGMNISRYSRSGW